MFRRGSQAIVVVKTIADSLLYLRVDETQLAKLLQHPPNRYIGANYIVVFSLSLASSLGLELHSEAESDEHGPSSQIVASDVHGNYYEGDLKEVAVINEGEPIKD